MPRGAAPGERRGGRGKGSLNKKTVERMERERLVNEVAAKIAADTVEKAKEEERRLGAGASGGRKLAKERLEELLELFIGAAGYFQPRTPEQIAAGQRANPNQSWPEFERWAIHAMNCAKEAAKYQSPQFRAIVVAPAPDTNQPERRKRFTLTIFEGGRPTGNEAEIIPPRSLNGNGSR